MDETTPIGWQRATLAGLLALVFVLLLVLAHAEATRTDVTKPQREAQQQVDELIPPTPAMTQAGVPFRNLLLSVECEDTYATGTPVTFTVHEKNVGKQEIRLAFYRFPYYYKLDIQDANGKPVEKAEDVRRSEDEYEQHWPISRPQSDIRLQPGEEFTRSYDLRAYVKALPPGQYSLQVMRRAGIYDGTESPRGGALSLPCRFTVE